MIEAPENVVTEHRKFLLPWEEISNKTEFFFYFGVILLFKKIHGSFNTGAKIRTEYGIYALSFPCFRESNLWKKKKAKEKDLVKTFLEFHKDFGKVL